MTIKPPTMSAFVTSVGPAGVGIGHHCAFTNNLFLTRARPIHPSHPGPQHFQRALVMVAKPENEPNVAISTSVEKLYDEYPFPPETLLDELPLGYNWRWHYPSVHAFCTGSAPAAHTPAPRILDAGCGTGESTSYLVHFNQQSSVTAIDLSSNALAVAKERLDRSLPDEHVQRCEFVHKSLFDLEEIPGTFDMINCVGVIHHTPDPLRALRALASKLAPGGLLHIFVYGAYGRHEISLMQEALRLLQKPATATDSQSPTPADAKFETGVALGRRVFAALPDGNRLKVREATRWAQENLKDATFADMYLHPQEVDYDVTSLFALIDDSGLDFVSFSNPYMWDVNRVLGADPALVEQAGRLPPREQFRLVELLDPESVTHFEFFLSKPPLTRTSWQDESQLRGATAVLATCLTGWPAKVVLDRDYLPVSLDDRQHAFMSAVADGGPGTTVGAAIDSTQFSFEGVRELARKGLIMLTPALEKQ